MKFFKKIVSFFKKLAKSSLQAQLEILVPIADEAVRTVAKNPSLLTSAGKRESAIAIVLAELAAKELVFLGRVVNLAIEIAVVEFKGIEE